MQLLYDINRSIKAYPPITGKGIKSSQREEGSLEDLVLVDENDISLQPRIKKLEDTQYGLVNDFTRFGVDYTKEPMIVERRPDGNLELISGFGRHSALTKMGVTKYFYEVVEFDSPYDKIVWKRKFNCGEDHRKKGTPNGLDTYKKGLVELKRTSSFNFRSDTACRLAIQEMADGTLSDEDVEVVLKRFRKSNTKEESVEGYTQAEANKKAKELGYPTCGYVKDSSNPAWDRIGFVRHDGDFSSKIQDILKLYVEQNQTKVEIIGFIQNPIHDRIANQRKNYMKKFDATVKWMEEHLKEEFHNVVEFQGFLPQILTADPNQNGLSRERALVDKFGKHIK
tara:strand:- start:582 stop:1598 length:1017 start_codon:yes stop_codon:yes gene_type:complete